jgi:lipid-binding SYLF domain-containing protein
MGYAIRLATALLALATLSAGPALAASSNSAAADNANNGQKLVNDAVKTVPMIAADHVAEDMLKHAKGVFIMPNLTETAFQKDGQGAQGVVLKHNSDGTWSDPTFLTIASISANVPASAKTGPAAFLLMTDKALNVFTQQNNFSLGANAGFTIVGTSAMGKTPVGNGDILIWSDHPGAFAGSTISGAELSQNTTEDHNYYGHQATPEQIVAGTVTNTATNDLRHALPS